LPVGAASAAAGSSVAAGSAAAGSSVAAGSSAAGASVGAGAAASSVAAGAAGSGAGAEVQAPTITASSKKITSQIKECLLNFIDILDSSYFLCLSFNLFPQLAQVLLSVYLLSTIFGDASFRIIGKPIALTRTEQAQLLIQSVSSAIEVI
jgi:hypothetical protein